MCSSGDNTATDGREPMAVEGVLSDSEPNDQSKPRHDDMEMETTGGQPLKTVGMGVNSKNSKSEEIHNFKWGNSTTTQEETAYTVLSIKHIQERLRDFKQGNSASKQIAQGFISRKTTVTKEGALYGGKGDSQREAGT